MSLPYFPLFPGDFDADTGHLTLAEDGAYNRLLRLQWRCPGCKMPADMEWIFRKTRAVTEADQAVIASVISEFFTRKAGKIFNERLIREHMKSCVAHSKRVLSGSKGGSAKTLKIKPIASSNAQAMLKQPEPEPEPEPELSFFGSDEPQKGGGSSGEKDTGFERFWAVYPLKKAKAAAEKNWRKAVKKVAPEIIIAAAERYANSREVSRGFAKYPQGWLTDERWLDEDVPEPSFPPKSTGGHRLTQNWGEVVR